MILKIILVALMGVLFSSFDTDYTQARTPASTKVVYHTVKQGETLWEIGEKYYDGSEPFEVWMSNLRKDNGFEVGSNRKYLYAGEVVKVVVKDGERRR